MKLVGWQDRQAVRFVPQRASFYGCWQILNERLPGLVKSGKKFERASRREEPVYGDGILLKQGLCETPLSDLRREIPGRHSDVVDRGKSKVLSLKIEDQLGHLNNPHKACPYLGWKSMSS